jgi:hypothetical protein
MSQKKPKDVQVGPFTFTIKSDKASMDSARGRFESLDAIGFMSIHEQTIFIDPELQGDINIDTLLHEILHAIFEVVGLKNHFEEKEEEQIIAAMSPTLLDTLRRNVEVTDYILGRDDS